MKIGIIGAGNIGGNLARRFVALGHEVVLANSRGPQSLEALAREIGAEPVTVEAAVRDRDVVVVTIPEKAIPTLPHGLLQTARPDTVVIDTGNYYPQQRDGRIDGIEQGNAESAWVAQQLGHTVIKAFNNIYAKHLLENGRPAGAKGRIALPVAGDDATAKAKVMQLVDSLGFDAVDAGSLADSWRQQPGSPVYGTDLDAAGVRDALGKARRERAPEWKGK